MRQSISIAAVFLLIILMGLWGQYVLSPDAFAAHFSQRFYDVLTLFALEGGWTDVDNLPWQIEVARVLAPLATIGGILIILTRGAWVGLLNYFVRFRSDHVIVVRLNDRSRQFLTSCEGRYSLVAVEQDPDNPLVERARSAGVSVIIGDILQSHMFERVALHRARHLVYFEDADEMAQERGYNIEVALKARQYMRNRDPRPGHQLRVHVQIADSRTAERVENYPKFFEDASYAEVSFFSEFDLTSRMLFHDYPPEIFADVANARQVHIGLYTFGTMAITILLQAFRICHFRNGSKLRFTIFDNERERHEMELRHDYPQIFEMADVGFVEIPMSHTYALHSVPESLFQSITQHVICIPTDRSLHLALTLRSHLLELVGCNAPILVRMHQSSGLAQLLESNVGAPEIPDGLYPFGMFEDVLDYENILSDGLDKLARAIHEDYLETSMGVEADARLHAAQQDWRALPEPTRKDNRLKGDHLALKMRAVGCRIAEGEHGNFQFTQEEAELLARMEHDRWRSNRRFDGWTAGPERVEGARINPYMIEWDNMAASARLSEIGEAMRLPRLLEENLSSGIQRECLVGVTAHRLHKLDVNNPKVSEAVRRELANIVARHPEQRMVIVSPLAEGGDRLIARIAMAEFAMVLWAPLPLPYELHQTDFTSPGSDEEYKELVGKAERYYELPMKFGSIRDLAVHEDGSPNPRRNQQYALAGAYIAQRCHELIAIYDGEPAAGEGGTGQVIEWRRTGKIPEEYRFDSDFFAQPQLAEPVIIHPTPS